jgi:hypothetical protein
MRYSYVRPFGKFGQLQDPDVDGRMILKIILKYSVKMLTGFMHFRIGANGGVNTVMNIQVT